VDEIFCDEIPTTVQQPAQPAAGLRKALGELQMQVVAQRSQANNIIKKKSQNQKDAPKPAQAKKNWGEIAYQPKAQPMTPRSLTRSKEHRQLETLEGAPRPATPRRQASEDNPQTPRGYSFRVAGQTASTSSLAQHRLMPLSASTASTRSLDASIADEESPGGVSTWSAGVRSSSNALAVECLNMEEIASELRCSTEHHSFLAKQSSPSPGSIASPSTPFFGTDGKCQAVGRDLSDENASVLASRAVLQAKTGLLNFGVDEEIPAFAGIRC